MPSRRRSMTLKKDAQACSKRCTAKHQPSLGKCVRHVKRIKSFTYVQGSFSRLFKLLFIPRGRAMLFALRVLLVEFASSSFLSC
jgi:hypothetical protein